MPIIPATDKRPAIVKLTKEDKEAIKKITPEYFLKSRCPLNRPCMCLPPQRTFKSLIDEIMGIIKLR
jgi:hypothetical protein